MFGWVRCLPAQPPPEQVRLALRIARLAQGGGEVGDVGRFVLATEEDLVFGDFAVAGGGGDLLDEPGDSSRIVFNREGTLEDVTVAVAE